MNKEMLLKIVEILESLDERITRMEESLENLRVGDHYFSSWGSDRESIKEIKNLLKD